jgi:hypothetical protein
MARSPSKSLTPTVANPPDSEIPCPGSRKHGRTPSGLLPHVRFTKDGGGRSASQHLPGPFPRSQRGGARPLGPAMLRAAVVSSMTQRGVWS